LGLGTRLRAGPTQGHESRGLGNLCCELGGEEGYLGLGECGDVDSHFWSVWVGCGCIVVRWSRMVGLVVEVKLGL